MPAWRSAGSVLQTRTMKSARGPLVMNVLEPLITYSSPSRIARGADAGDVGAGARLGDPQAGDLLALQPRFEVLPLLLLGAEQVDRRQRHVGLHGEGHVGPARAGVAHALGPHQRVEVVAALAAVLLGEAEAEEAEVAGALHRRGRPVGLLPLVAVGPELLLHPGLHRLAQVFVLLAEDEVLAPGLVVGLDHAGAVARRGCHCLSLARFAVGVDCPPGAIRHAGEWTVALPTFDRLGYRCGPDEPRELREGRATRSPTGSPRSPSTTPRSATCSPGRC